jgi:maleate isomerase
MKESSLKRIGLIIPSSNTTMEPDFYRSFASGATIHAARMFLDVITQEVEKKMIAEDLPGAIALLKTLQPDVVVFGCTSGGALGGIEHDRRLGEFIRERGEVRAVTVLSSVISELERIRAKKIGVFTPYTMEISEDIKRSLEEAKLDVAFLRCVGLVNNTEVGSMEPDEICSFVRQSMDSSVEVDALFLSCTNWRAYETIPALRSFSNIPIVTSNQATIHAVRHALGLQGFHGDLTGGVE